MLDRFQCAAFGYFLDHVDQRTGLVADTSRPGSPASIAVVGFALSCYPVGVERGWMERADAVARILVTLRFFCESPQSDAADATGYKGFYYHFLDMETGRRAWKSELSLIDTTLLLAGAQAGELGLLEGLRREFGPEAHLAVTSSKGGAGGVFAMAARAAREDEVAEAVQRRMAALAPARLSGTRPGILAMFVEDTDRLEWRTLRDQLRLEGAARQFLTRAEARCVVAVTCASRLELFGAPPPDAAEDGEMRFRNPSHKQAGAAALAPSVLSTL